MVDEVVEKVVEDDATTAWTHKSGKQKDLLSTMICIHFINLLCKVDKPYFFLLKSDQLIDTGIPVSRYAGRVKVQV